MPNASCPRVRTDASCRGVCPVAVAVLAAIAAQPRPAAAQHRWDLKGSLALGTTYDDNVFRAAHDQVRDQVSSVTPRVGVGLRSRLFELRAEYAREAERFTRNPELTTMRARQDASLDLRWSPDGKFEAVGRAYYGETHDPAQFPYLLGSDPNGVELVGLQLRRTLANRVASVGSLSRRLGARTRITAEHGYTRDEVVGVLTTVTQVAGARIDRRVGPVDALALAYGMRQFTALGSVNTSHAVTLAWSREVTPRAHLELKGGARVTGREVGPELGATLRHRFHRGDAALSFVQTETAVIGRAAPIRAKVLGVTLSRPLGRNLTVSAGPSLLQTHGKGVDAIVYGTSVDLTCRLGRHLSLAGTHRLTVQDAELDGRPRTEIVHNTVLLRLVAGAGN